MLAVKELVGRTIAREILRQQIFYNNLGNDGLTRLLALEELMHFQCVVVQPLPTFFNEDIVATVVRFFPFSKEIDKYRLDCKVIIKLTLTSSIDI